MVPYSRTRTAALCGSRHRGRDVAELRFVDGIDVSPTVLLDLGARPLAITSFKAPPPSIRRNEVSSYLADGAVDAATAWDRRELSIGLAFVADSAEDSADAWRSLVQALTAPGWLMHVDDTGCSLFFRTNPSSPADVEEFRAALSRGERKAELSILADPFAYGLPESGTATVANDPTQPNGMRFSIDDVKGDMPTPLRMDLTFSSVNTSRVMIASTTDTAFRHAIAQWGIGDSGVTTSTVSDASAIGGSYSRASIPAFPNSPTSLSDLDMAGIVPGEYRVMIRARASVASAHLMFFPHSHYVTAGSTRINLTQQWRWHDAGVVRLPGRSRRATEWEPSLPGDSGMALYGRTAANVAGTIDLDHFVLLPVPGSDLASGRFLSAVYPSEFLRVATASVSGRDEAMWSPTTRGSLPWNVAPGFPHVTPGAPNSIVLLTDLDSWLNHSKTGATTVDWSYHPRYLYLRGD